MSLMDQAFIKAYAKESPVATLPESYRAPAATAASRGPGAHRATQTSNATRIDEVYAGATLYRLDALPADEVHESSVSAPHYGIKGGFKNPASSRRAHRSILDRLAELAGEAAAPPARPSNRRWPQVPPPPGGLAAPAAEHEPEIIFHEPLTSPKTPAAPPAPPIVPDSLNSYDLAPTSACVHIDWQAAASARISEQAQVVLPEAFDFETAAAEALLKVEWRGIPEPPAEAIEETVSAPIAEPVPKKHFRVDAAHAAVPAPHEPEVLPAQLSDESDADDSENRPAPASLPTPPALEPEYELAAAADTATVAKQPEHGEKAKKPCVPLWEVDRFTWPETCDKLLKDDQSYFSQAGTKLLAATRDGLKTLAITGSRRGEGRTTLALCLARAAAAAGIQVALVDADFARPQLAGRLGLEVAYGWQDAALGKIPLAEAAVKSVADKITALPLEQSAAGAALSLNDPRVTATLRAAAATFELVILDLGPLASGHQPLFPPGEACPLDATIIVRDMRYASIAESNAVGDRLFAAGVEAVGIAENFVTDAK